MPLLRIILKVIINNRSIVKVISMTNTMNSQIAKNLIVTADSWRISTNSLAWLGNAQCAMRLFICWKRSAAGSRLAYVKHMYYNSYLRTAVLSQSARFAALKVFRNMRNRLHTACRDISPENAKSLVISITDLRF